MRSFAAQNTFIAWGRYADGYVRRIGILVDLEF